MNEMTNSRFPFRLNVGFITKKDVGYSRDFPFEFDKIRVDDDLELCHLEGTATIGRTPQGLLVQGNFSGEISLECGRCLTNFDKMLSWEFTDLYAFNDKSVSESDLILPDDAHIDLGPLMREYALLEVPINPICKPDCNGLCSVCGENLNDVDCGHKDVAEDSPFSALKDFLEE